MFLCMLRKYSSARCSHPFIIRLFFMYCMKKEAKLCIQSCVAFIYMNFLWFLARYSTMHTPTHRRTAINQDDRLRRLYTKQNWLKRMNVFEGVTNNLCVHHGNLIESQFERKKNEKPNLIRTRWGLR